MGMQFDQRLAVAIVVVTISIAGLAYILFVPKGPVIMDEDRAVYACVFLCKAAANQGQRLDDGPCLSTGIEAWDIEDWVCDVAHNPREAVDSLPENQCPEYGVSANHFVEVTPKCIFIRSV
jgi:hypothetical protein